MPNENGRFSGTEKDARFLWRKWQQKDTESSYPSLEQQIYLHLAGKDITPKDIKYTGMAAILTTSDSANEHFYADVRAMQPDGYIVGIGMGGILSFLEGFTDGTDPKGIIAADINPFVVAAAKLFTSELLSTTDPTSLLKQLYLKNPETYHTQLDLIARESKSLHKGFKQWRHDDYYPPRLKAQEFEDTVHGRWSPDIAYSSYVNNTYPHIPSVIFNHFDQLQQLARSGKIATFYTDFRNPDFIDAVSSLPDFSHGTNIIYTTNSIDCHMKYPLTDIRSFTPLAQYDNPSKKPIFVAATKPSWVMKTARSFSELQAMYEGNS